jgi:carbamoyl-phosphate synthase large subunit
VIILGSGPNRIGQGVEFDYCCVRAVMAFREMGYRTVMVNSNPETVSTDYRHLRRAVLRAADAGRRAGDRRGGAALGVVVQLGRADAAQLARGLEQAGVPILGTIARRDRPRRDRGRFEALARNWECAAAQRCAESLSEALAVAGRIGYPVLVRPSYVLGGRGMRIVYDDASLQEYFASASGSRRATGADRQLPGRRLRSGRGRHRRRHPVHHRRRHAAHRGCRHPLR